MNERGGEAFCSGLQLQLTWNTDTKLHTNNTTEKVRQALIIMMNSTFETHNIVQKSESNKMPVYIIIGIL